MFKLFDRLKKAGFFGVDDLETSLFEYNFIMRETEDGDYQVIFALYNDDFPLKVMFDYGFISQKDINEYLEESWFDLEGFLSYTGDKNKEDFLSIPIQHQIYSLFSYYGYENFGFSCYYPLSIYSLARGYKN